MRFILFDRWGEQLRTVTGITSAEWAEELNGEDTLTLTATDELAKGQRVVWCDQQGIWHEHTVASVSMEHAGGEPVYTATCENSISELYGDWVADKRPSGSASLAVRAALETSRWTVGTVDVEGSHSASLYRTSAREALQTVVETWGGELSTTIAVSGTKVTSRRVNLTRRGSDNGRRFTYGRDMLSIARTVDADDVVTALYGFGKGEEVGDGYGRGIDFADVNGGKQYVEDLEALETWGRPDGSGGKAHVFGKFEASDCDDPEELLELTRAELERRKEPKVSYEASVSTFADYGYDFSGVALGDDVALVDMAGAVCFRAKGRVTRLVRDMLDEGRPTEITIGNIVEGVDGLLSQQYADLKSLVERATGWDVAAYTPGPYIQQIMDGLNREFDAGASYIYQSPEQGFIVASVPLDPETGRPLSTPAMAIQLKGGGFRIAKDLLGDGSWNWRTVGTGAGFVADYIIAGNLLADLITTGTISDRTGSNYWDLDSGEFRLAATATIGGKTADEIAQGAADGALDEAKDYTDALDQSLDQQEVFDRLTAGGAVQGITMSGGQLYINAEYIATGILSDLAGRNYWNLETGDFSLSASSTVGGQTVAGIAQDAADGALSDAQDYADAAAGDALESANGYADSVAGDALEEAKAYADGVGNDSLGEAKDYTDLLDAALDQRGVFDRLTNGGQTQGIYLQGGSLYINGSYIASGVIDADLIKAGVISDATGSTVWDLETGSLILSGDLTISGGRIQSKSGGTYWDLDTGEMVLDFSGVEQEIDDAVGELAGDIDGLSSRVTTAQNRADSAYTRAGNAATAASNAQTTANSANSKATSAKSKTDRISFSNGRIIIDGTYNTMTYGSNGIVSAGALATINTNEATMTLKDWGFYVGSQDGSVRMYVTKGSAGGGTGDPVFNVDFSGTNFLVSRTGVYWEGRRLAFADEIPT